MAVAEAVALCDLVGVGVALFDGAGLLDWLDDAADGAGFDAVEWLVLVEALTDELGAAADPEVGSGAAVGVRLDEAEVEAVAEVAALVAGVPDAPVVELDAAGVDGAGVVVLGGGEELVGVGVGVGFGVDLVGVGVGVDLVGVGVGVVVGSLSGWHDVPRPDVIEAIRAATLSVGPALPGEVVTAAATSNPLAVTSSTPPTARVAVIGRAFAKRMNSPYQCCSLLPETIIQDPLSCAGGKPPPHAVRQLLHT